MNSALDGCRSPVGTVDPAPPKPIRYRPGPEDRLARELRRTALLTTTCKRSIVA